MHMYSICIHLRECAAAGCARRLAGRPPFWNRKQMLMLRQIVNGEYTFGPEWEDISSSAKDLVRCAKGPALLARSH